VFSQWIQYTATHTIMQASIIKFCCLSSHVADVYSHAYITYRKHLDVDEITIDASASWTPVDKHRDTKDDGKCILRGDDK